MDMRKTARVYGSFPVRMRGFDESGRVFKTNSLVDNLSAGGLFMQIGRRVAEGSRLFVLVRFMTGAIVAARGVAVRIEQRPHGLFGVAVRFTHARLLPSKDAGQGDSKAACLSRWHREKQ
jgi:hypothetical protein